MVHLSERITAEVHDVFTVFRAQLIAGTPLAGADDEDVSAVAWVPVEEASALMPWYPDGVAALLTSPGSAYTAVHS